jgi:hypothetical protein
MPFARKQRGAGAARDAKFRAIQMERAPEATPATASPSAASPADFPFTPCITTAKWSALMRASSARSPLAARRPASAFSSASPAGRPSGLVDDPQAFDVGDHQAQVISPDCPAACTYWDRRSMNSRRFARPVNSS